ncbi:MAG: surface-adhesin E family protein [Burkholderiales bacterium]
MTSPCSSHTVFANAPRVARVKRQAIAALLLTAVSAGAVAQVLILTGSNAKFTVFVDPRTVQKNGGLVNMTSVFDYKDAQTGPEGKKYLSTRRQFEYDCKQQRMRAISMSLHPDQLGKGDALVTTRLTAGWSAVADGSADETLWNYACDKKADGPGAPKRR